MNIDYEPLMVDCPTCPKRFRVEELVRVRELRCPGCGSEWQVNLQDVPGRFLIDLVPQREN
jgi:Zn finger protein HypA/HybF involved in hydrogenase expression